MKGFLCKIIQVASDQLKIVFRASFNKSGTIIQHDDYDFVQKTSDNETYLRRVTKKWAFGPTLNETIDVW